MSTGAWMSGVVAHVGTYVVPQVGLEELVCVHEEVWVDVVVRRIDENAPGDELVPVQVDHHIR